MHISMLGNVVYNEKKIDELLYSDDFLKYKMHVMKVQVMESICFIVVFFQPFENENKHFLTDSCTRLWF